MILNPPDGPEEKVTTVGQMMTEEPEMTEEPQITTEAPPATTPATLRT